MGRETSTQSFNEGMVDDGYVDVVNIDISSVEIDAMNKKHSDHPQLKYLKLDVRDMKAFEDASFDVVIDKGTLDSLPKYVMREVIKREKDGGIIPDPEVDASMKAISVRGLKRSLQTDYILKILGLDIYAETLFGHAMRRGISWRTKETSYNRFGGGS
ncbi:S-adenosyl-L-methionine-dependent methyltransferases superfamily protein [Raphanus sativus]|nr:S-adenosyl-L-methionine-dependent methyltransferases superfamily protein [Raphanus sativus]